MFDNFSPEVQKLTPGVAGSALAVMFMRRPMWVRLGMLLGGSVLSWYATDPVAEWLGLQKALGFTGFLVGMFGMAIIAKIHDTIDALSPAELIDAIRKRLGL